MLALGRAIGEFSASIFPPLFVSLFSCEKVLVVVLEAAADPLGLVQAPLPREAQVRLDRTHDHRVRARRALHQEVRATSGDFALIRRRIQTKSARHLIQFDFTLVA